MKLYKDFSDELFKCLNSIKIGKIPIGFSISSKNKLLQKVDLPQPAPPKIINRLFFLFHQ